MVIAAAVAILAVGGNSVRDQLHPPPATSEGTSDLPPAPWRADPVARQAVPAPFTEAWDRAANRTECALLFPLNGGPELADAKATYGKTPDDRGWDIFLTGDAGSIEVLGLFDKATQTEKPASFARTWSDGSVATYYPDVGNVAPGTYDPNTSPFEAVLTLPDQDCAYRLYDTLGRAHLESLFDRLRLLAR